MLHIRQRDYRKAISLLAQAYNEAPERPDITYAFAIALHDAGQPAQAIKLLENSLKTTPTDVQALIALATYHRDMQKFDQALTYAKRAAALLPEDQGLKQFVQQLEGVSP